MRTGLPLGTHGTINTYVKLACRCEKCKAAARAQKQRALARRRERKEEAKRAFIQEWITENKVEWADEYERSVAFAWAGQFTVSGECWEFTGRREGGYGRATINKRQWLVHRYVLTLKLGHEPDKALHRCDNPPCFRPLHIYDGSPQDNADDRAAVGHTATGERHGKARLTVDQVRAIRAEYAAGGTSHRRLGDKYGICAQSVAAILHRRTWRGVD